jgi:hypothetical protein
LADFGFNSAFQSQIQQMQLMQQMQQMRNQQMAVQGNAARQGVQLTGTEGPVPHQAGSLYLNDTFIPSSPLATLTTSGLTHGNIVAGAARGTGFHGPIVGSDRSSSGPGPLDRQTMAHQADYSTPGRTRAQTIADLKAYAGTSAASLLAQETGYLNRLTQSGANHSAANLSQGVSKSSTVMDLYKQMMPALRLNRDENSPEFARANGMMQNVARAAGLDESKLRSPDERVRNAERGRMTQFLINQVSQGMDSSPALATARRNYNTAVHNFEARQNSVVVSAGNEGTLFNDLREVHGNYRLSAPSDFSRNILQNNEVTSVGATELRNGQERRASYTSNSPGIDIYAAGGTGIRGRNGSEIDGTSFAAPQVAATMAELHRRNPNMGSAQIEALMKNQLTHQVSGSGETALDHGMTSRYLAGQTF